MNDVEGDEWKDDDDDSEEESDFYHEKDENSEDGVVHIRLPGNIDRPVDRYLARFEMAINVCRTKSDDSVQIWPALFDLASEIEQDLKRSDDDDDDPAA